jgi:DNA 3'-phosphatase
MDSIVADPTTGREVRAGPDVGWSTHGGCLLVRTVCGGGRRPPVDRVAGFDLDHTLVNWRCSGWPSRPDHYELWNSGVVGECRRLHDSGYGLVVFTNQGGIKSALGGKRAGTVRGVIDWIAHAVDRPLFAVVSTKADSGYHKGSPGMWEVFEERCNLGRRACPGSSFFVGDADGGAGDDDDATDPVGPAGSLRRHQQTGTDKSFARNVGKMRDATMEFFTPGEYFGPSDAERRRRGAAATGVPPAAPREAMCARAALLGGYSSGPICLVLVGVQGSGKTTFCRQLVEGGRRWRQCSQDTIRNGSPGTRQAVEEAARDALRNGDNAVIDRMHLDEEQRGHFVRLGKECQVPVHCLVLVATREEVEDRVRHRVDHPGKVQGEDGALIAVTSLSRLTPPTYDEGFALISYSRQMEGRLWIAYQMVNNSCEVPIPRTIDLHEGGKFPFPMVTLGTMNIKRRDSTAIVTRAVQMGVTSVDTAPTYSNESEVGAALETFHHVKVTIKIPKRATSPEQARKEVMQSLSLLRRSRVDIILLHWPCDFIESGTLSAVWKELETMKEEGLCLAIGVCNFTTAALMCLLANCAIKPALNQVERHPLLPQYNLMDFCDSQGIIVQSHTAFGSGSELLLANETIVRVARESRMSPAQGEDLTSRNAPRILLILQQNHPPPPPCVNSSNFEKCCSAGICSKIHRWSLSFHRRNTGEKLSIHSGRKRR